MPPPPTPTPNKRQPKKAFCHRLSFFKVLVKSLSLLRTVRIIKKKMDQKPQLVE
jgi:hypothetical protein